MVPDVVGALERVIKTLGQWIETLGIRVRMELQWKTVQIRNSQFQKSVLDFCVLKGPLVVMVMNGSLGMYVCMKTARVQS